MQFIGIYCIKILCAITRWLLRLWHILTYWYVRMIRERKVDSFNFHYFILLSRKAIIDYQLDNQLGNQKMRIYKFWMSTFLCFLFQGKIACKISWMSFIPFILQISCDIILSILVYPNEKHISVYCPVMYNWYLDWKKYHCVYSKQIKICRINTNNRINLSIRVISVIIPWCALLIY